MCYIRKQGEEGGATEDRTMTCTGGRLAACLEWKINRPSPVMSAVTPEKVITQMHNLPRLIIPSVLSVFVLTINCTQGQAADSSARDIASVVDQLENLVRG